MYRTKVLIVSDSPGLPSGIAEVTRNLFEALLSKYPGQYDISQIGLCHCLAVCKPSWPVFPTKALEGDQAAGCIDPADQDGDATLRTLLPKLRPDIVFAFNAPGRLLRLCQKSERRSYKLVVYLKIDSAPLPADLGPILNRADKILTMSDWSRGELLASCPALAAERVDCLYPPADTERFAPLTPEEKAELRQALLPEWMPRDAFVLGWVGLPRWRKQVWILYRLIHYLRTGKYLICDDCERITPLDWDPLDRRHFDGSNGVLESRPGSGYAVCSECGSARMRAAKPLKDLFLWLHMLEDDPFRAWELAWLEHQFGVQRNQDIFYTAGCSAKAALAPADMPTLYQLWDGLAYLSGSEGFGLPAWEAMCCGLPVIYTDYSSHAELLSRAKAGLPVEGTFQPEDKAQVWAMIADLPSAVRAVRKIYFDRDLGKKHGARGRAFVCQYRTEIQVDKWHELFQEVLSAQQRAQQVS